MQDKLERLIKVVYKKWKLTHAQMQGTHPNEEDIACFLEGRLSGKESENIKAHLISCDSCAEVFSIQLKLKVTEDKDVPRELLGRLKDLIKQEDIFYILEIFLRVKERTLEVLHTTGDVLVGQEVMPVPLLRSRQIKDFRDQVTILKDFEKIRVELKIENKQGEVFNLTMTIREKDTQRIIKDLRVTLIKDELELESYLADYGKITFEHVLLGRYTIEISTVERKVAHILLDIRT